MQTLPLEVIADWLKQQTDEVQDDIAFGICTMIGHGDWSATKDERRSEMFSMLEPVDGERNTKILGRTLAFKACLEFYCHRRFYPEAWADNESMFKSVVAEAAADQDSDAAMIAPDAFKALRQLPVRKDMWLAVGQSWQDLVDQYISNDALGQWQIANSMPR